MNNYYICGMHKHKVTNENDGRTLPVDSKAAGAKAKAINAQNISGQSPDDESEMRKRIDARTEYLNSIKLKLS